jgi:hypothetical protein
MSGERLISLKKEPISTMLARAHEWENHSTEQWDGVYHMHQGYSSEGALEDRLSGRGAEDFGQISDNIILFHWLEKRGLGNPRYSRPGGRRYISDGSIFKLSESSG